MLKLVVIEAPVVQVPKGGLVLVSQAPNIMAQYPTIREYRQYRVQHCLYSLVWDIGSSYWVLWRVARGCHHNFLSCGRILRETKQESNLNHMQSNRAFKVQASKLKHRCPRTAKPRKEGAAAPAYFVPFACSNLFASAASPMKPQLFLAGAVEVSPPIKPLHSFCTLLAHL